ncbi:MAG: hypothetical protein KKC30_01125 [Proteobacteria bacterium]|nr:hypothetical protein [Pseudomonadota bacterium]MBU4382598.1 hypothetical protein [Pseudomonadota bacterium]MBU4606114.1 hypothetical protein [Pseudomonadota bacterium]MCG2765114.1 hypothetical protein [Desulfarculaceae bacterium]
MTVMTTNKNNSNSRNPLWSGNFWGHLVSVVVIAACTFVLPLLIFNGQMRLEDIKVKQETIKSFSKNITEAIYFQRMTQRKDCELRDKSLYDQHDEIELGRNEYYKRLIGVPETYEAACELVKVNYGDSIAPYVDKLKNLLEAYMDVSCYKLSDNEKCVRDPRSKKLEEDLLATYDIVISKMSWQLRQQKGDK